MKLAVVLSCAFMFYTATYASADNVALAAQQANERAISDEAQLIVSRQELAIQAALQAAAQSGKTQRELLDMETALDAAKGVNFLSADQMREAQAEIAAETWRIMSESYFASRPVLDS